MIIKKPARIESSAVYLKIVDSEGKLLCFISNTIDNKEIAEEIVSAINREGTND